VGNRRLFLIALALTFMSSGCAVRESAFRVHGKIESATASEDCTMEVYRADTGALVDRKTVPVNFKTTVVTAPGIHKYYLTISCPGSEMTYKSPVYEFGSAEAYQRPVDLGTISLRTKTE
jgi:hypothetical protein